MEDGRRCEGTNLQPENNGSVHTDYQEIKIQEAASKIGIGSIPRSLLIKLQHDLVDRCQPGDEVTVVGSLLAQWQQPSIQPGIECNVGIALEAHSIQVVQENGSSAWKQSGGEANHSIQMESYKKEFDSYWSDLRRRVEYPIAARDFICRAVCPKLYGLNIIKLALIITLIGGVPSDVYGQQENQPSDSPSGRM
jgi:DNA helicase MCM9